MYCYLIECYSCDEETQVMTNQEDYTDEPTFCPMCGSEVNAQIIESLCDADDEEEVDEEEW